MPDYRWSEVWKEALAAYCLAVEAKSPVKAFHDLMARHPRDAMIFFERGEALESLGMPELARADYHLALSFPNPKWAAYALRAIQRIDEQPVNPDDLTAFIADAIHRAHLFHRLGSERLFEVLSGFEKAESDPKQCLAALRRVLEKLVDDLPKRFPIAERSDFGWKIEALDHRIAGETRDLMKTLWHHCNAQHGYDELRATIGQTIELFLELLTALDRVY